MGLNLIRGEGKQAFADVAREQMWWGCRLDRLGEEGVDGLGVELFPYLRVRSRRGGDVVSAY